MNDASDFVQEAGEQFITSHTSEHIGSGLRKFHMT